MSFFFVSHNALSGWKCVLKEPMASQFFSCREPIIMARELLAGEGQECEDTHKGPRKHLGGQSSSSHSPETLREDSTRCTSLPSQRCHQVTHLQGILSRLALSSPST